MSQMNGRINDYVPWFRVYSWDGSYRDIAATLSESSGKKLKDRMFELYNDVDVKAVVVLTYDKTRVIKSVRRARKDSQ